MRILCAGDGFVSSELLAAAVRDALDDAPQIVTYDTDWPDAPFRAEGPISEFVGDPAAVAELSAGVDAIMTHTAPISREVLAASDQLRFVGCCRGGPTNVDVAAADELGVTVSRAPGRNGPATAEFALALMLSSLRNIPTAAAALREGRWAGEYYRYENAGEEVGSKTVAVIGLGQVGGRVAQGLTAIGATVLGVDPMVDDARAAALGVELTDLDDALGRADVITLHVRATPETERMIGPRALELMRPGAFLVNTARGSLIDTAAVLDALDDGRLSGAAFDVFDPEPPTDERLYAHPRVTATPHLAGGSRESAQRGVVHIAEELARLVRGEPLASPVTG